MNHTPSTLKLLMILGPAALGTPVHASGDRDPVCPVQISESSVTINRIEGGWRPYIASPIFLHSVAPTDGPPERLGQLIGKELIAGKGTWTTTYELRGAFPEGKWLQCSYGMLNEVVLSKRLDDSISSCTIQGRKGEKAGQNVFSVNCR